MYNGYLNRLHLYEVAVISISGKFPEKGDNQEVSMTYGRFHREILDAFYWSMHTLNCHQELLFY